MIVRRLRMECIRSYKRAEVEFPGGRTLFSGDIGTGKSTILMAIEFALFGLGSAKAGSLLRNGESRGSVELEFEVGGREYWVRRVLAKKNGSIQQVEGKLRGPEGEEDYPPAEMKERILEILGFRESTEPKARSLIYQYAIYSPQEEMKVVLGLRPSDRLSILRRAFGVEEYSLAMENAKELARKVHDKRLQFEGAGRDVPALKKEVQELDARIREEDAELERLERSVEEREKALSKLEAERRGLHDLEVQLASVSKGREEKAREVGRLRREIEELTSDIARAETKRAEMMARAGKAGKPPTPKSVKEIRAEIEILQERMDRHRASDAELGTRIGQFESVAQKGRCPVCDSEVDAKVIAGKLDGLEGERRSNSAHLERLTRMLGEMKDLLEEKRGYDNLAADVERLKSLAKDFSEDLERKEERVQSAREDLEEGERKLTELGGMLAVLERETKGLEELQSKIDSTQGELKAMRDRRATLRSDVRKWREDVRKRSESIERKERAASKAAALGEREMWLEEFFVPTLRSIESHVMTSINGEFGASFQRWFGELVDDPDKEARVDEEFTPVVDQGGYDQDVDFLSGGERTSVALAYRLALSQMVQKYAETGPSALILDEPTDGFSKEQLGKVRGILDEMENPQVIIVSHERELESMADQVYRVAKVDGESKVTR
ncbi:MAG TPA: SMC family ATPase [Nitrososphaerales archaeon]|nr:SMC family ATPase [Nitrososphaerales archaeon]